MKRLRKVILGVLCMLLLFALSHATDIKHEKVEKGKNVEFAWDETTELSNSEKTKGCVVKYHLYVTGKKIENRDPSNKGLPKPVVITGNKAIRKFPDLGKFYIGVATAIYLNDELMKNRISDIAWSHDKSYTNGNPFLVEVE